MLCEELIITRFYLAQGSHQATNTKKYIYFSIQQNLTLSTSLECTPDRTAKHSEGSRCSI